MTGWNDRGDAEPEAAEPEAAEPEAAEPERLDEEATGPGPEDPAPHADAHAGPPGAWQPPGPYGWHPPGPVPPAPTGLASTALVLGVVGVTTAWIPFLGAAGLLAGIAALVVGLVARRRARQGRAGGAGTALAGVITGAATLLVGALGIYLSSLLVVEQTADPFADLSPRHDGNPGEPMSRWERDDIRAGRELAVGETATLGPAEWTVTGVDPDADVDLSEMTYLFADEDLWTEYRVVVVDLAVENVGHRPARLADHLMVKLVDSGDRVHFDTCEVDWPGAGTTLPNTDEIAPGERAEAHACFVVRAEHVARSRLTGRAVNEYDDPLAVWQLP